MEGHFHEWERPLAAALAWLIIGILVKLAVWNFGPKLLKPHVRPPWITLLSGVLKGILIPWFCLAGLAFAIRMAPLNPPETEFAGQAVLVLFLGSLTLAVSVYATRLARHYGNELGMQVSTTSLTLNMIRVAIVIIGVLIILSNLGISITPLLTALGVGSLAVALAIQDTLSNFFSGFGLIAGKYLEVGDYIRIDSLAEGTVEDIAWRSCRLRDRAGNKVIVPNNKLVQSVVTVLAKENRP